MRFLPILLACALLLSPVWAQEGGVAVPADRPADRPAAEAGKSGEPVVLPKVVVTATRTEKDPFAVPAIVELLDRDDLRDRRVVRTLPEALEEIPGVMVQKTSYGQGSPYLRGFTGFRTLMLIDGIRVNNSVFRDGPNQYFNTVDPFSIDRLEVVKGPGSVLYGSDAIGGTVHALTRGPDHDDESGFHWERRLYYRYASAEHSHIARAEVSGPLGEDLAVFLGLTGKDFGDLDGGREVGRQRKTGYHEGAADLKLDYRLGPSEKIIFAHQRVDQDDAWRTHRTVYGISWEGTAVGNERKHVFDQDRDLTYLQYHAHDLGGFVDAIRASVSYQGQYERQARVRSDGRADNQGISVRTTGAWIQLESPSAVGRWTWGGDFYFDNVNSFNRRYDASGGFLGGAIQGPVADDAHYALAGVFLQDEIPVTERLDLILGGRYTYARTSAHDVADPQTGARISLKDHYEEATASVRGRYRLDAADRWQAFAGVSQGFRAPNLSDLTRLDTARSGEIETPSPGLEPEQFLAFEAGLKTRHGDFTGQASAFYTVIDDMIMRTPTGRIIGSDIEVTKKNAGDGSVWGFEATLSWRFLPEFTAFGSFAWMDSQVKTYPTSAPVSVREPLDRQMPPTGILGVRWDDREGRLWAEGLVMVSGRASELSSADKRDTQRIPPGGTPSYTVVTLRGGARLRENLNVTVAVENLTNEDYRIHGSGVNEPGTNVVLALDWTF
ncbi:MAG: TonB-dependent receptor [Planctomycetes bacterium]|nr:TonB-dependent receptor [Planctomycetota bacterium]